jgi:protein-disulfide isomerase
MNRIARTIVCAVLGSALVFQSSCRRTSDASASESGNAGRPPVPVRAKEVSPGQAPAGPALSAACGVYRDRICERTQADAAICQASHLALTIVPDETCEDLLANIDKVLHTLTVRRKDCDSLTARLCEDFGPQSDACATVRTSVPLFVEERCTELLTDYDQTLASLGKDSEVTRPIAPEHRAGIEAPTAPSLGPERAPVTIVLFSGFACSGCADASSVAKQMRMRYGDQIRVLFRTGPQMNMEEASLAARAGHAAEAQGRFWPFHDLVMSNRHLLTEAALSEHAEMLALDLEKFSKDLHDPGIAGQVDRDLALAGSIGLTMTPAAYINGRRVPSSQDPVAFARMIDKLLQGDSRASR